MQYSGPLVLSRVSNPRAHFAACLHTWRFCSCFTLCHAIVLPEDLWIRPGGGTGTQLIELCSGGGAGRNTAHCAVFCGGGGPEHSTLCCVLAEGGPGHSTTAPLLIPHLGTSEVLPWGFRGDPHTRNPANLEGSGLHTAPRFHFMLYFLV